MEELETCLGHITKNCPGFPRTGPHCKADEKNKECPNYSPTTIRTFEVTEDYSKQTQTQ